MTVVNRRNAIVGFVFLAVAKRAIKDAARQAVPTVDRETKRPNKSMVALAVMTTAGAVTYWRARSRPGEPSPTE